MCADAKGGEGRSKAAASTARAHGGCTPQTLHGLVWYDVAVDVV